MLEESQYYIGLELTRDCLRSFHFVRSISFFPFRSFHFVRSMSFVMPGRQCAIGGCIVCGNS